MNRKWRGVGVYGMETVHMQILSSAFRGQCGIYSIDELICCRNISIERVEIENP